jgi:predicted MFS family arabinose efflux permease
MFLQYAVPGSMVPLVSLWLDHDLQFTPGMVGLICATQALAGVSAPLLAGQVADRWIPAQYCLVVAAFAAGLLLWLLAGMANAAAVFGVTLAFWMVMGPTVMLGTALCFAHLPFPDRQFGPVRMWGTVGWVTPLWLIGYWRADPAWLKSGWEVLRPDWPRSELADAFRLGGVFAFLLALYALTLPHTPPIPALGRGKGLLARAAPLAALRTLGGRAFAIYCLCSVGVCVTLAFVTQVTPLLLTHVGVPPAWVGPTLSIAQSTEILSLALLPILLARLGPRQTMLLGLTAWALEFGILTLGRPMGLVIGCLALQGICICCFLVAGQVFVNSRAQGDIRASAQALLTFVNGLGLLIGNLLVGWVRNLAEGGFPVTFAVGAIIAIFLALIFAAGFPSPRSASG